MPGLQQLRLQGVGLGYGTDSKPLPDRRVSQFVRLCGSWRGVCVRLLYTVDIVDRKCQVCACEASVALWSGRRVSSSGPLAGLFAVLFVGTLCTANLEVGCHGFELCCSCGWCYLALSLVQTASCSTKGSSASPVSAVVLLVQMRPCTVCFLLCW
jgi:hypothetical protein